jgi:histone acetyltransferase (RNA polymerase elongator complex component)
MKEVDIEELDLKAKHVLAREFPVPTEDDVIKYKELVKDILKSDQVINEKDFIILKRKHKFSHKKSFLFHVYLELKKLNLIDITNEHILRKTLQIKPCKSWSGLVTITIFTAAYPKYTNDKGEQVKQPFSCVWNCFYCPNESGPGVKNPQPRSYLTLEPAVLRANRNNFDCAKQIWDRLHSLYMTGHNTYENSKYEIIVSGGTWTSYPQEYRKEFCRDIYYAANTYQDVEPRRERLSLEEEKLINQTAKSRIIGLVIETRPDTITQQELKILRYYGVCRIQLGIQHIDDDILDLINRKCKTDRTIKSIQLLKENCFKIDSHWMLNLPGSSPEKDNHMLNNVLVGLNSPTKYETKYEKRTWYEYFVGIKKVKEFWEYYNIVDEKGLICDSIKLYPMAVLPFTTVKEWYENGKYVPYDNDTMFNILIKTMTNMLPWVRVSRIIRDIPKEYMYNENTGADNTSMRQELNDYLLKHNIHSMDIRNREVKNNYWDGSYIIVIRKYKASNGDEYFISAESNDKKTLYGFVRLRLDHAQNKVFEELNGSGLIREVHVYGDLTCVGIQGKHVQHKGIGRTLMNRAEELCKEFKYTKAAVIAAEGNKEYYKKLGYIDSGNFMIKTF